MNRDFIPHDLMRELRSSVIFLGAILTRFGTASLSMPGGCELGPRPVNLHLDALRALGAEVTERGGDIVCCAHDLKGRRILLPFPSVGATENAMLAACAAAGETVICNAAREPYPGFPTDAQPPLMAACLKAKGTTVFTENIFTNRYRHAEEFRRLGAAVSIEGRVAYVTGVDRLTGAPLTSSDLRGGAAMIVAGLSAEGETEILDNGYINRGYDRFDACLSALGADVRCAAPR